MTTFEEMNKLLSEYSPDWEKIKDVLNKSTFTQEELARLGIEARSINNRVWNHSVGFRR